jgi:sugar phosphate permease
MSQPMSQSIFHPVENKVVANQEKMTKYRWIVMTVALLVTVICNADRANFGIAMPFIRKELLMTNTEAGAVMSLFFLGYAIMQLPGGFITSKFGMRKVLSFSVFITSFFTAGLSLASSVLQFQLLRLGIGIVEGPTTIGIVSIINNWFPPKEKGTATGIFLAGSKTGPLIVPPICVLVMSIWGWREIFLVFAIPGILISIVWYLIAKDNPIASRFCSQKEVDYILNENQADIVSSKTAKPYNLRWVDKIIRARKVKLLDTNKKLFCSWNLIGDSLSFAFLAAIVVIMMSWFPTYLITVKHFSNVNMAFAAAAPFAGTVIGNLVGGWMGDKYFNKRRKPLMLVSTLSTAIMMYCLIYAPADPLLLGGLMFITGFLLALGYNGFYAYPMGLVTKERFPVAAGIMNTGGQLGGAVAPLIVGMVLDQFSWNVVFALLAVGSIICTLIVFSIVEPVDDPLT